MRTAIRKRKTERVDAAPALRDRVQRQLAAAANAHPASHNDPLYSVTETFQQEFQRIGRQRSEADEDRERSEEEKRSEKQDPFQAEEQQEGAQRQQQEGAERKQQEGRAQKQKPGTPRQEEERPNAAPMRKFSKMAFQRGELSAAVMQGTGKLVLMSCLKRAVGDSEQSGTLFGLGAQTRNVPSRDPDKMMFHRNFAKSAVGLVVDALRDARRSVESLTEMAAGTGEFRERDGGATLRAMYPFLDDSRERELLAERRERLKGDCTAEERAILENAAVRANALIAKKARMKEEFIQKLREVSDRATEALAELEAPETVEEAAQALMDADAQNPPPDEGMSESSVVFDTGGAEETESSVVLDTDGAENAESSSVLDTDGAGETEASVVLDAESVGETESFATFSMDGAE